MALALTASSESSREAEDNLLGSASASNIVVEAKRSRLASLLLAVLRPGDATQGVRIVESAWPTEWFVAEERRMMSLLARLAEGELADLDDSPMW